MKRRFLFILFLVSLSQCVSAYEITNSEFSMLPQHCKAVYAEIYQRGKTQGLAIDPTKYHVNVWKRRIGNAWTFMNHYCPGLVILNNAKISLKGRSKKLEHAKENISYQISHAKWTPSNYWFLAEAHMKLAEVAELANQRGEAMKEYREAIKIYPKNYRFYLGLSRLLAKNGSPDEALTVIREGLKQIPKSRALKRKEKNLMK